MFPKQFAKIILSLLVQIIGKWIVYCQAPNIEWQYCYGGNSADGGRYILQTIDGGFAICGSSYSNDGDVTTNHGLSDYWILKISGSGELEWQKSYGGSNYDYAQSIQQTNDGGYIVAGVSASVDGDITGHHGINKYDYWIIKLSFAGELEWEKSFGGTNDDYARSVKQVSGDGYIITGSTWSNDGDVTADPAYDDVWVVKISDLGTLQWQQLYHKFDDDYAMEIQQTLEGGYITVGGSNMADAGATGTELYIIKLTDTGIKEWEKTYGGIDSESGLDIHQTSDSGYIIGGEATSNGGDVTGHHGEFYDDYWIVKLDSLGNLQWEKCLGGTNQESGAFISQTIDSGYIISGASTSNDGDVTDHHGPTGGFNQDYWIVKLTGDGIIEWKKSLGGIQQDAGGPILQLTDSSFIVAGTTYSNDGDVSGNHGSSDIWVVKLSNCPKSTYYFDEDGDGFGNILGDTLACYMLSGYVTDSTDCNDTNPDIHPLLFDICNSIDDNCNGLTDEDAVFQTYFADIDGDTYGDPLIDS
ncbi:MAG TPA: putative metal-binding motif-containing protein, partial [Chitinophagales bacterium]|nr:putative metal-binding motif-containing protein [Chitinophagales bacterium]